MSFRTILIFLLLGMPLAFSAFAQNKLDKFSRCRWVNWSQTPRSVDTLTIFPHSITIKQTTDTAITVDYDINTNRIEFNGGARGDSVYLCYETLPFLLNKPRAHRESGKLDSGRKYREQSGYMREDRLQSQRQELFATPGLQKTGNISRGISFGNNQDVIVNSNLNLQLDGKLTENISVTASISDQQVPFQPEGNTQNIQEFDEVFIKLRSDIGNLKVGDLLIQNKPSYFLQFDRNVQGGQVEGKWNGDSAYAGRTNAGMAISKGKFNSMVFSGFKEENQLEEGVQGPYRLKGADGEEFIVVLANSEEVYLDGKKLKRGYNYDYVIDYNQAQITFTNRVTITKFSRVRVDFEYAEREYSRTVMNASHYQNINDVKFFTNFYRQKDNARNPNTFDLSQSDREYLSSIGDTLDKALISGVDTVEEYSDDQILYKKKDTIVDSTVYSPVYIRSTNPDSARYSIVFTEVGQGNGNYVRVPGDFNGQVYRWVAPENGIPQGNYAPIRPIETPKEKQMINFGGSYSISENQKVLTEVAFSKNDVNLFSNKDSDNDDGYAVMGGYENEGTPVSFLDGYEFVSQLHYEFMHRNFEPVDRIRGPDFERNWSEDESVRRNNQMFRGKVGLQKNARNKVSYQFSRRVKPGDVNGRKHEATANKSLGNFQLNTDLFLMESIKNLDETRSDWRRYSADFSYQGGWLKPGYKYTEDRNVVSHLQNDSVVNTSMNYKEHLFYVESPDSLKTNYRLDYSVRDDRTPFRGEMAMQTASRTTNLEVESELSEQHSVRTNFTYRYLKNNNLGNQENPNEETVQGRLDWKGKMLNRHIKSDLTVSSASGRERKTEFVFREVQNGQGTHIYGGDYDNDGEKDLDEFELSRNPTDKKNYIRINVPTDEFVRAFSSSLNYKVDMQAPRHWRSEKGIKNFLGRFSNVSSWNIDKKVTADHLGRRFIPFEKDIPDNKLQSINENFRSTLFFNRTDPRYGVNVVWKFSDQKQLLTDGFQQRGNNQYEFNGRYNIKRVINLNLSAQRGIVSNGSDFLINRNYKVKSYRLSPEITYQPGTKARITGGYAFENKRNTGEYSLGEKARIHDIQLKTRVSSASKRSIEARVNYIDIHFRPGEGEVNSPVSYELLDGLNQGVNWTWALNVEQRLANGLQVSVNYEGRKSKEEQAIHRGTMQVSALF